MNTVPVFLRFASDEPRDAVDRALAAWFSDNGWGGLPRPGTRVGLVEKGRPGEAFAAHVADRGRDGTVEGQYVVVTGTPAEAAAARSSPDPAAPTRPGPAAPPGPGQDCEIAITYRVAAAQRCGWLLVQCSSRHPIRSTPGLVRTLTCAVHGMDGDIPIRLGARMIQPPAHADVLAAVHSPTRTRPVFVVGSAHGIKLRRLADLVDGIVADADGLALTYVLDGPATAAFDEALTEPMRVGPGCARIYHPPAADGRHTGIGTDRLLSDEYGLRRELWHVASAHARAAATADPATEGSTDPARPGEAGGTGQTLSSAATPARAAAVAARLRARIDSCRAAVPRVPTVPMPPAERTSGTPETAPEPEANTTAVTPDTPDTADTGPTASAGPAAAAEPGPEPGLDTSDRPAGRADAATALGDLLAEVRGSREATPEALAELRTVTLRGVRRIREQDHARTELVRLTGELAHARGIIAELRSRGHADHGSDDGNDGHDDYRAYKTYETHATPDGHVDHDGDGRLIR